MASALVRAAEREHGAMDVSSRPSRWAGVLLVLREVFAFYRGLLARRDADLPLPRPYRELHRVAAQLDDDSAGPTGEAFFPAFRRPLLGCGNAIARRSTSQEAFGELMNPYAAVLTTALKGVRVTRR